MEDSVSTFGSKAEVLILISRDVFHVPTEFNKIITSCLSISQSMVESHCEILWDNNLGAGLGRHPTADYGSAPYYPVKQLIITQQCLRYKVLGLWINYLLTTDYKLKLRDFRTSYTFNNQDDRAVIFFIVKMVRPVI